jgi:hypothetical protein
VRHPAETAEALPPLEIGLDHPVIRGRTGRGVSIAVIDSGVNPGHPHVLTIAGGVAIEDDGRVHDDLVDRLGHGTAVVAAIQEKAPGAEVHVVRVFHGTLSTNVEALVQALDWATERGIRLVNLSLGTANAGNAGALLRAVDRGREAGAILVSAHAHRGNPWYPGCLPGVIGVSLDPGCPREAIRLVDGPGCRAVASGFARPIPGVPMERNLNGVSFSVANTTGLVARLLEADPSIRTAGQVGAALRG